MRFFICEHCKNIITFVEDSGVPVMCCGQKMTELVANTTDAAQEKHVPVVEKDGDKLIVSVGSVEHPMTEEHHICLLYTSCISLYVPVLKQIEVKDDERKTINKHRTYRCIPLL